MIKPRARSTRRGTASTHAPRFTEDATALELAFDQTPRGRAARRKILALQRRLERRLDERAWQAYCALEAAVNERLSHYLAYIYARLGPHQETRRNSACDELIGSP